MIIETLTDNKNRSASSIKNYFQKNGGRLGETGSTNIYFLIVELFILIIKKLSEDEIFELAINSGAKDCLNLENYMK